MKRYFFAPIIGDGQGMENPFRSRLSDESQTNVSSYIPTDEYGHPVYAFSYDVVSSVRVSTLQAIAGVYLFPDVALDVLVSAVHPDSLQGLLNELDARSIDRTFIASTMRWRDVLYGIGQRMAPGFNFEAFDVMEVS